MSIKVGYGKDELFYISNVPNGPLNLDLRFYLEKNDSLIFVSVMIKLFQFVPKLKAAVLYPFAYIIIRIETRSELIIKLNFCQRILLKKLNKLINEIKVYFLP